MEAISPQIIAGLESKVDLDTRTRLKDSAQQYEAVFMSQMMQAMFKEIDLNPMSEGSSAAEDTYKGMLTNELGSAVTKAGPGIGLADPIYKTLLEAQIASQEKRP